MNEYTLELDFYEGPIELLIYLARREEIDIYEVPISKIAKEYLEYVKLLKLLNIDSISKFIVMAAILMRIKVRRLLVGEEDEEVEVEEVKTDLKEVLSEYRKFKEIAEKLSVREEFSRRLWPRPPTELSVEENLSIFDLLTALREVIERAKGLPAYEISRDDIRVEDKIEYILNVLSERKKMTFAEFFKFEITKIEIIVTFIALLELIRIQKISARQRSPFGDIWISLSR